MSGQIEWREPQWSFRARVSMRATAEIARDLARCLYLLALVVGAVVLVLYAVGGAARTQIPLMLRVGALLAGVFVLLFALHMLMEWMGGRVTVKILPGQVVSSAELVFQAARGDNVTVERDSQGRRWLELSRGALHTRFGIPDETSEEEVDLWLATLRHGSVAADK